MLVTNTTFPEIVEEGSCTPPDRLPWESRVWTVKV
jgi:hypothetical protein